ncbi:hypothetical protein K2X33_05010 [bacterium]|nr:hypothetical protein [bacterium]
MRIFLFLALTTQFAFAATDSSSTDKTSKLEVTDGKMQAAEQPPPQQDRAQGSKAAAKAAASGAMMGKIQCMMLMDKARKTQDSGDSALMMMMASQQCQQAQEMQKSAEENDKSNKQVSAADIPKQAQYTAGKSELKDSDVKEERISFDDNAPERTSVDPGDLVNPPAAPAAKTVADQETESPAGVTASPGLLKGTLNPIEKNAVKFDDSEKNGMAAANNGMPFGMLPSGNATAKTDVPGAASAAEEKEAVAKTKRGSASEAASAAAGGEESPAPTGDATLDELMAQLMGSPEGDMEFISLAEPLDHGGAAPAEDPGANIFEYASLRFGKLTQAKRLGHEPQGAARSLSSVGL